MTRADALSDDAIEGMLEVRVSRFRGRVDITAAISGRQSRRSARWRWEPLVAVAGLVAIVAVAGAVAFAPPRGGPIGSSSSTAVDWQTPSAIAEDAAVEPVSLSWPTAEAKAGIQACGVRKWVHQVAGIGIVAHARLLPDYVPLTGREPEIQFDDPAFVVQFDGVIQVPTRSHAGIIKVDGLTCGVIRGEPFFWSTGPWFDENDIRHTPEPAHPTKVLPPLLP